MPLIRATEGVRVWGAAAVDQDNYDIKYDPTGSTLNTPSLGMIDVRGYSRVQWFITGTPVDGVSISSLFFRVQYSLTPQAQGGDVDDTAWTYYTHDVGGGSLQIKTWSGPDTSLADGIAFETEALGSCMRMLISSSGDDPSYLVSVFAKAV